MNKDEFQCALCGRVLPKIRSEEDTIKEAIENFGSEVVAKEQMERVCEKCYQEFMEWYHATKN